MKKREPHAGGESHCAGALQGNSFIHDDVPRRPGIKDIIMNDYSKKQKQELRKLASKLYEIEMNNALEKLFEKFTDWKSSKINCFDLDEEIHLYKKNVSKELYLRYSGNNYHDLLIARGILDELIALDDVPEIIKDDIKQRIEIIESFDEQK